LRSHKALPLLAVPMRIAYADPPYIGCAHLYKDHADYGGEVSANEELRAEHIQLKRRLESLRSLLWEYIEKSPTIDWRTAKRSKLEDRARALLAEKT
jgi:hypothetical protein